MVLITLVACGAAVAIAVSLALVSESSALRAGRYQRARLDAGGDVYHYGVYVPAGYRAASAVPLVVVLHGCNTTADQQAAAPGTTRLQSGIDLLSFIRTLTEWIRLRGVAGRGYGIRRRRAGAEAMLARSTT